MKNQKSPYSAMTDAQLAALVMEHNDAAFTALYERHSPHLKTYLNNLLHCNRSNVEETMQLVWIAAWQQLSRSRYRENGQFALWLNTISHHLAMKSLKNKNVSIEDLPGEALIETSELQPEGPDDTELAVQQVVVHMQPRMKQVVYMHTKHGKTCREIAEKIHSTAGSVSKTLYRAHIMVRKAAEKMKRKENFYSSAVKLAPSGIL